MTSDVTPAENFSADASRPDGRGFAYKAFLSYSHRDEDSADRLHRQLERYRVPKHVRQGQAGIGKIFRDKVELSAASELDASIKAALRISENLIVLCSPNAVASQWVDQEIAYFKSLRREDRIFTVLISGIPFAKDRGYSEAEECLPKSIRYELTQAGDIIALRAEPLATDLRPGGDGQKLGLLKLVSGLLGLGLDQVLQRQLIRTRRRMIGVLIGSSCLISLFAGLSWATHTAQVRAEARQADAENFVEFLLNDLSHQLETYGRLDLLDTVGAKAVDYHAQFDEGELDARASGRKARTFHFMGELQNALAETESSQYFFDEAYMLTKKGLAEAPQNPERIFEHARSAYFKSLPLRREVNYSAELVQLEEFAELGLRLEAIEGKSSRVIAQMALANMNLGRVKLRTNKTDDALVHFTKAETLFEQLSEVTPSIQTLLDRTENLAWLAVFYRVAEDFQRSYDFRVEQDNLIDTQLALDPDDFRLIEASVYAKLGLANAANFLGRGEEAKDYFALALNGTEAALQLEPRREKMRRAQSVILLGIMRIAIVEKDKVIFLEADSRLKHLLDDTLKTSAKENKYWDSILPDLIDELEVDFD